MLFKDKTTIKFKNKIQLKLKKNEMAVTQTAISNINEKQKR